MSSKNKNYIYRVIHQIKDSTYCIYQEEIIDDEILKDESITPQDVFIRIIEELNKRTLGILKDELVLIEENKRFTYAINLEQSDSFKLKTISNPTCFNEIIQNHKNLYIYDEGLVGTRFGYDNGIPKPPYTLLLNTMTKPTKSYEEIKSEIAHNNLETVPVIMWAEIEW